MTPELALQLTVTLGLGSVLVAALCALVLTRTAPPRVVLVARRGGGSLVGLSVLWLAVLTAVAATWTMGPTTVQAHTILRRAAVQVAPFIPVLAPAVGLPRTTGAATQGSRSAHGRAVSSWSRGSRRPVAPGPANAPETLRPPSRVWTQPQPELTSPPVRPKLMPGSSRLRPPLPHGGVLGADRPTGYDPDQVRP